VTERLVFPYQNPEKLVEIGLCGLDEHALVAALTVAQNWAVFPAVSGGVSMLAR
jgi:hypothetical protein